MSLFHSIQKQTLRRAALDRRGSLSGEARAAAAQAIVARGLDLARAQAGGAPVALFRSYRDEIDTGPLMAALAAAGFALALPVVVDPAGALAFRRWAPGEPLAEGYKGIAEPPDTAAPATPRLLFVPLVAFDRRGYRLGYGEGHYDRTLVSLKKDGVAFAAGLAYADQETFRVPDLPHDVRLDAVLTERELVVCGGGD
jgi:5-formyltetrahydrofolate cyclo-ligase